MDTKRALTYVTEHPQWLPNLGIVTIAQLVPLLGPIVLLGYFAYVIESVRRGGEADGSPYPMLELDRLSEFASRGFRIFLILALATVIVMPIFLMVYFGVFLATQLPLILLGDSTLSVVLGLVSIPVVFFVFVTMLISVLVLITPLHLRAALNEDLAAAYSLDYIRDYLRRYWKPTAATLSVVMALSVAAMLGGMLALFIGMFPAMAYMQFVHNHMLAQLADGYERAGGLSLAGEREAPLAARTPPPPPLAPTV